MDVEKVLAELRDIMVAQLRFEPRRASELTLETRLPKGLDGALGLDSLDFIDLSVAIESRFGLVMDESQDLAPHFASLGTLVAYIRSRTGDR